MSRKSFEEKNPFSPPEFIERARIVNPAREPGRMTDLEREAKRLFESGEPQTVEAFTSVTHQYWAPFNYPNIRVELGQTDLGAECNPDGIELEMPPGGAITIVEKEPIIGVTVIGSACEPSGCVLLQAEPLEWKFPRTGVKMKIDNLWGCHIRGDAWKKGVDEGWPLAGLSCADFHIPESSKVTIMAFSQFNGGFQSWEYPQADSHYCIRLIRVTLKRPIKEG